MKTKKDAVTGAGQVLSLRRGRRPCLPLRSLGLLVIRSLGPSIAGVLGLLGSTLRADEWSPNLTATVTWNDNATGGELSSDKIAALQTTADIVGSERYALGAVDSLHPAFHFAGEWWPRFNGLTQGEVGAQLQWQHMLGTGTLAPEFSLEGGGDYVAAKETGRRGTSLHVRALLRKRFNDRWLVSVSHEYRELAARYGVFDREGNETAIEIGRDLTDVARFTLRASYRSGDVLSYAVPPRPDLAALASDQLAVDTFGRPMVAYSIPAHTLGFKGALIRALDQSSAVIIGYEWRKTSRDSALRYANQLVSLSLVHQF